MKHLFKCRQCLIQIVGRAATGTHSKHISTDFAYTGAVEWPMLCQNKSPTILTVINYLILFFESIHVFDLFQSDTYRSTAILFYY